MSSTAVQVFDKTIQKTNVWLRDIMAELQTEDHHKAYLALRATLQTLRDRLTVEETTDLGAQLPMLIRGFYYENWNPSGKPSKIRHKEEFLEQVSRGFRGTQGNSVDPEQVVRAVFKVLTKHVSEGEIEDIRRSLPEELVKLWP